MAKIDYKELRRYINYLTNDAGGWNNKYYQLIRDELGEWAKPSIIDAIKQQYETKPETEYNINPDNLLININDEIPDPEPIFKIGGQMVCSLGNILTIKAKQKGYKTGLLSCLVAANFTGNYLQIEGYNINDIAWMDNEQSFHQCHYVNRRTRRMCNIPPFADFPEFKMYYASELTVPERWELFVKLAKDLENKIIIIDVSTDLINDINDPIETKEAADKLQRIAKENNILIIATIHENKKDSNATGFFGGSLQKKSEAVISIVKTDDLFTVSATDTRHGDFPDFSFTINDEGIPVSAETPIKMTATQRTELNIKNNLRLVLATQRLLHKELIEKYINREMCSESTAKRHIKTGLSNNWIKIHSDNRYSLTKIEDENE